MFCFTISVNKDDIHSWKVEQWFGLKIWTLNVMTPIWKNCINVFSMILWSSINFFQLELCGFHLTLWTTFCIRSSELLFSEYEFVDMAYIVEVLFVIVEIEGNVWENVVVLDSLELCKRICLPFDHFEVFHSTIEIISTLNWWVYHLHDLLLKWTTMWLKVMIIWLWLWFTIGWTGVYFITLDPSWWLIVLLFTWNLLRVLELNVVWNILSNDHTVNLGPKLIG